MDGRTLKPFFVNNFRKTDIQRLLSNPETWLDVWICLNFNKLPTEQCFLDLSPEQKQLLFEGAIRLPGVEQIRKVRWKDERVKEVRMNPLVDSFLDRHKMNKTEIMDAVNAVLEKDIN